MRVLIVDDNPENLYLLRALLQGHGHEVDEARHGAEALVKARAVLPRIVISDLLMPVMDGFTLLRQWGADARLREIPFVVYTATYTDPKDERLALDLGADAFILKPAEPAAFVARIDEVLAAQGRRGPRATGAALAGEENQLTQYSRVLVHKLEEKTLQVERTNRELREDIERRERAEAEVAVLLAHTERARSALLGILEDERAAQSALRRSEERFRKVFADASLPMSVSATATGTLLEVNEAYCAFFGFARAELVGRTTTALALWADPAAREALTARLLAERRVRDFEARRRLRSGELRDVVVSVDLMLLGDERCTLAILQDITELRRAERERAAALERFEKIFHSAPLPCIVSTLKDGRVLEVNDAYCALVGRRRDLLIGHSILELGVWSDPGERAALVDQLREGSRVRDTEVHIVRSSGEVRAVLVSAERIDFLGEPCTLQMGNDITERKLAEEALRVSEQRFRLAAAAGQVWDWNIRTGEISAQQPFWSRLGYEAVDARDQLRMFETHIHPEDLEPWRHAVNDHLDRQRPYGLEFRMRAKAGDYRWFQTHGQAVWDDDGRATYMAGTTFEITERKLAERAVHESEERLRRVLDNMFPFVGLLSLDGRVLEANRAPLEAAGLTREEVIGQPCAEILWFSYSPAVQERLRAALARAGAGEAVRYDETIQVAGERLIEIDLMFSPLRDAEGRVLQIVGSATDITERKRSEAALRASRARLEAMSRRLLEAQEAERRMVARELHDEVGSVLTAVKLNLQALARSRNGDVDQAALADSLSLVDGAIGSVRSLSLDLRPAILDDLGLIPALKWYCERQAQRAGVPIELELDAVDLKGMPQLESACYRIVQESVTNALRHAGARRIWVTLRRDDGSLALEIADDGGGFQAAAGRTGMSSGLHGMEERASLLGGRLRIDSAPGAGTRIRAELPLADGRVH